ncbi:kelch-like protein 24 [Branchiostoma floridae x Branchiostoma belcheri]
MQATMGEAQRSQTSTDFCHDAHSAALLQGLQKQRSENLLVDVVLCVSGKEIPCHRNVLAACSEYFRGMFCNGHRESNEHKVVIHEANVGTLQLLVDYAYTSRVTITDQDNAIELMEAASYFQVPPVIDACAKFLIYNLSVKNCLQMVTVGGMLNSELEAKALSFAMKEFAEVSKAPEFLDLTKDRLIKLVSSDDLNAPEETAYTAVKKWINYDTENRQKDMKELVELVRFPFMDKMFFIEEVETDDALRNCCPDLVPETLKYQAFPGEVQSPRTRPRRASGLREAVVIVGGVEKILRGQGNSQVLRNSMMTVHCYTPSITSWIYMPIKNNYSGWVAVAVLGTSDIVVSVGGLRDVWLYRAKLDSWSKLAPMNVARDLHKLAVVQGKVYVIGGKAVVGSDVHAQVLADVEVYDQSLNKWTQSVPLPAPRCWHAVAVLDGSIYVMGGAGADKHPTSTSYRFSPGDSQWHSAVDMPVRASGITATVLNGSIYVNAGFASTVLCYRPQDGLWTVVAKTGTWRRSMCGMAVFGGEIYIYGGTSNNNDGTTEVLWLNQEDKSLKQVGTMPKGLFGHGCVTILKG